MTNKPRYKMAKCARCGSRVRVYSGGIPLSVGGHSPLCFECYIQMRAHGVQNVS